MRSSLSRDQLLALKAATRRLIADAGGVESASTVTRVSKSQLGHYQNPQILDSFMPIDVVADLERDTQGARVTAALADLSGATITRYCRRANTASLPTQLSRMGKEFGDVFERAAMLTGSSIITETQRQNLIREIEEAIGALIDVRAAVEDLGKTGQD